MKGAVAKVKLEVKEGLIGLRTHQVRVEGVVRAHEVHLLAVESVPGAFHQVLTQFLYRFFPSFQVSVCVLHIERRQSETHRSLSCFPLRRPILHRVSAQLLPEHLIEYSEVIFPTFPTRSHMQICN